MSGTPVNVHQDGEMENARMLFMNNAMASNFFEENLLDDHGQALTYNTYR